MERFFKDPRTIKRFRSGPLGSCTQQLVDELVRRGYSRFSIRVRLRVVHHFGRWLQRCGVPLNKATPAHAERYLVRHGRIKEGDAQTLRQLFDVLAVKGLISRPPIPCKTEAEMIVDGFSAYLQRYRALAPATIEYYRDAVLHFLRHRFGDDRINLATLEAPSVINFISGEAARLRSMHPKNTTTALRAFFRYLHYRGLIDRDLSETVPSVAYRSLSCIPRSLSRDQANRVLAACDRKTAIGRRDYAILLLLARLGLRGGEVARIELDDIDWMTGTISVPTKGGKQCTLPLPHDVGEAIALYLRKDRPLISSRRLFLRIPAPATGFSGHRAVSLIVKYALARAGVHSPSKGAHQFRHALATEMLQKGASLSEIGEVLRHRKAKTTFIYAKVDFAALRPLARPWPGGVK